MKNFLYWVIIRPIFKAILRILYPYKIINKKRTDDSYPSVIVCNHRSNADSFIVGSCFKRKTSEELLPFKNGVGMIAVKAKVNVIPIYIYKKAKIFRKNYVFVGEKFSLEEFYGIRDKSVNDLSTEKIREKLLLTKAQLNDYLVENKKIKEKTN